MQLNDIFIALIGVGGTLLGTIIGWVLSALSYKIGRITVHADFQTIIHLPAISLDGAPAQNHSQPKTEYLFDCVASNSKQIPVLLKSFHFEMRHSKKDKPIILQAFMPEEASAQVGKIRITAPIQFGVQRIEPRTLTEFKIKISSDNPDIQFSKIDLIAYNEKHKKQIFHIYNGLKLQRPPKSSP